MKVELVLDFTDLGVEIKLEGERDRGPVEVAAVGLPAVSAVHQLPAVPLVR